MSNAKRPTLEKKVTRTTKERRDKELNQGISIKVDGKVYTVMEGDLTGIDAAACRREVGLSFVGILTALRRDPDLDLIAAIVWLARRIDGERGLAFDEVANEVTYDTDVDIVEGEPAEDENPEA